VHIRKTYQIPEAGRTAKGSNIVNILELSAGEKVTAAISVNDFAADEYLFMVTKNGIVKKTQAHCRITVQHKDISCARRGHYDACSAAHCCNLRGYTLNVVIAEVVDKVNQQLHCGRSTRRTENNLFLFHLFFAAKLTCIGILKVAVLTVCTKKRTIILY
jgi:DNA gyrase/topoisomerase IV subunit A